ncbi:MAG: TatD family hydrolase [Anaerolineae bacterium]
MIDTHAHLDLPQFDNDREEVIGRALETGVTQIVTIGINLESSQAAIALAEDYPFLYATVGFHPHDASGLNDTALDELWQLAQHPRVVAIGETGLDYYRDYSPRDAQRRAFELQLALAREVGKPVIIHSRQAHADVMEILQAWAAGHATDRALGVMHCFSGKLEMLREVLSLGFCISLAGPVTFTNARHPLEVARNVPLDRLLVETDAPFLTPHPHRGKRNEPAYVRLVAKAIADIKGLTLETVASATVHNAHHLFGLGTMASSPSTVNHLSTERKQLEKHPFPRTYPG